MAGDLLLTNLEETELNTLLEGGGELTSKIFHADKYNQANWDIWFGRLKQGLDGNDNNNRIGLPPHFYISFSNASFVTGKIGKILYGAVRPLTIVSTKPDLDGWSNNSSAVEAESKFKSALQKQNLTLETYAYGGNDLIDRASGVVHTHLDYMELVDE